MAAFANSLALLRFSLLRMGHPGHRGGPSGILLLIGLAFAAVLIWALTRPRQIVR